MRRAECLLLWRGAHRSEGALTQLPVGPVRLLCNLDVLSLDLVAQLQLVDPQACVPTADSISARQPIQQAHQMGCSLKARSTPLERAGASTSESTESSFLPRSAYAACKPATALVL